MQSLLIQLNDLAVYGIEHGCPIPGQGDLPFYKPNVPGASVFGHVEASAGIRFQKRGSGGASVFTKWASAEPKTLFLEGIKRNQLPLLKF